MNPAVFGPSPLRSEALPPHVSVVSDPDPYRATREAMGQHALLALSGARILVKPNAGRIAPPGTGINTSPRVVEAVIDALREVGAEVSVGDSPIAGVGPMAALEASGIAEAARARGVPLLDLDARPPVTVAVPAGLAIQKLKLCAEVLEHDLIVSVPVIKTHMHTKVTLALKNMKGCLWRRSKVTLHMLPAVAGRPEKSLDIAITDLLSVLRPHLSVIDGTLGMEGLGPSAGVPKRLDCVVVSPDGLAADAVACALIGRAAAEVPHLALAAERGFGCLELDRLRITPFDWQRHLRPFAEPPSDISLEFPNIRVLDANSCSACQSTLLLYLKKYGDALVEYLGQDGRATVAIGKGHQTIEPNTLCLGNCTIAHKDHGVFVPGCPPVVSAIHTQLSGGPVKDDERR